MSVLKFNLISTHNLCKDYLNCEITFTHEKCLNQDHTLNRTQVLGNLSSSLCDVNDVNQQQVLVVEASLNKIEDAKLWHIRLGHLPFNKLCLLYPCFSSTITCDTFYHIYYKAKQLRISFPISLSLGEITSLICFTQIHGDPIESKPMMDVDFINKTEECCCYYHD